MDEYVGCGSIWDQLEDLTFRSPEAAARWVGRYWGWKSGVPSHIGDSSGGVGWWIHNTLLILNDPKARCSWWTLVPGTDVMMTGWHAELSFEARTAAGLVTLGVEEVASAWEV